MNVTTATLSRTVADAALCSFRRCVAQRVRAANAPNEQAAHLHISPLHHRMPLRAFVWTLPPRKLARVPGA